MVQDGSAESLWAQDLGDGLYRIDNIPFEVRGLALGDIVQAYPDADGALAFCGLYEKSGAGTAWIRVEAGLPSAAGQDLVRLLTERGMPYESYGETMLAVNVPAGLDPDEITDYCEVHGLASYQSALGRYTGHVRLVPGSPADRAPGAEELLLHAIFGDRPPPPAEAGSGGLEFLYPVGIVVASGCLSVRRFRLPGTATDDRAALALLIQHELYGDADDQHGPYRRDRVTPDAFDPADPSTEEARLREWVREQTEPVASLAADLDRELFGPLRTAASTYRLGDLGDAAVHGGERTYMSFHELVLLDRNGGLLTLVEAYKAI